MEKLYDLEYLEEISGGDKDFIIDMLNDFVVCTPETLAEIDGHIQKADWAELYKTVHRFIPSFDFVGAENIRNNLRILESCAKTQTDIDKIPHLIVGIKSFCQNIITEIKTDFKL